ncbi:hypothetical protein ACEPAG_9523 [Sanghuangporus baumii]
MFSTFTSMLPSGLGFSKLEKEREREYERERVSNERAQGAGEVTPRVDVSDDRAKESAPVDEHGVKKRRERNPNETFIVVRPPPSVSNHPLNLQLQLVPPQGKERSASGASGVSSYSSRPSGEYNVQSSEEGGSGGAGDSLSRAQSVRSNRSDATSFYASSSASMSSIASSASTTSTASGRRMIVPLYNLSAHNVMTNTVLDAGTDAKVAKFHRRGMEILGLAMLEAVEVWPSYGRSGLGAGQVAFLSASNGANVGTAGAGGSAFDHEGLLVTPTSSAISLSSAGSHPPAHTHTQAQSHPYVQSPTGYLIPGMPKTPTQGGTSSAYAIGNVTPTPSPSASGAKRIFGKIFKKRDSQTLESISAERSSGSQPRMASTSIDVRSVRSSSSQTELRQGTRVGTGLGVFSSAGKRRSMNASSPTPSHFNLPPVPGSPSAPGTTDRGGGSAKEQPQLQPPVLGIQPTLSAPVVPPAGRATRYVWIVRKWLKGDDSGLLGGVMRNVGGMVGGIGMSGLGPGGTVGSLSASGHAQGLSGEDVGVEVRFEWVRGQSKSQEKRSLRKAAALAKSGSTSFSQEDAGASASTRQRSRRSIAAERSPEGWQQLEKSRSRGRGNTSGRPATSAGTVTGPSAGTTSPRLSGESRRSAERTSENSRTNSMTSAFSSDRIVIEEDEGEESDPEDSETPWVCTLVVSSVPSNANKLWEHEYYEKDGGIGLGLGLSKKESRRSYLSQGGHASEASGDPYAYSNVPPSPPPKPASFSPNPSTPTPNTFSQHQQPPLQSASQPSAPQPPKPTRSNATDAPGTLLRLKVGALSPAPHHPKVVAQMKVPYPLPDVEVTRASVRRRVVTPAGVARPVERAGTFANANTNGEERERPKFRSGLFGNGSGSGNGEENGSEGLVLTAEEIKDVLSCTAFWIVVREGFGGVGKVNRKGDGWRIRG